MPRQPHRPSGPRPRSKEAGRGSGAPARRRRDPGSGHAQSTPGGAVTDEGGDNVGVDLAGILATLDSEVLTPIAETLERRIPVSDVLVFDPADLGAVAAGTIVLAVGILPGGRDAPRLLEQAERRGAAAVAFRMDRPPPEELQELATSSAVAILGVLPEVPWGHVYALLRTAMATTGNQLPVEAGVAIGDLFALADATAAAVGGPVTIEDPHWRVLAYSNLEFEIDQARRDTILGRAPPTAWQKRIEDSGVGSALRGGGDVVRFEGKAGEGLAPRLVAPVRAGEELLGSIWVAEAETPLREAAERELVRAAKVTAVHLLSHRASEDIKRRTRGAFVREILEGWAPSRSAVGMLRVSGPFLALVFAIDEEAPRSGTPNPERALNLISLLCEARNPEAVCALIEGRIWAVQPVLVRDDRRSTRDLALRILERAEASLGVRLYAAIGTTVPSIADIPRSRRAAEQALDVLMRRRDSDRVVHIEDVRAHAILHEIVDWASQNDELAKGKLAKVVDHDRDRGTNYWDTLRAYLDAAGDVRVAAKRLSIHPNTLRYRLKRLVELSGLDLEDPDERLVTELQLRMT